jgi:hypothetical protein
MNLIDKYVAEVGRHLPLLKGREDIEKELKSTLEDMLEDRAGQVGRPRDDRSAPLSVFPHGHEDRPRGCGRRHARNQLDKGCGELSSPGCRLHADHSSGIWERVLHCRRGIRERGTGLCHPRTRPAGERDRRFFQ